MIKPPDKPNQAAQVVPIKNRSKALPFQPPRPRFIALDDQSQRVILGIGKQCIALDFSTRITELAPATGDQPATVLPIKKAPKRNRSSSAK